MLFQHWLHLEIQYLFVIITRRPNLAVGLFSLLFFPGIVLHELSHLVAAWILRVPVRRFSLIPRTVPNGKIRLGFVETVQTDFFRDALIGTAPLLTGGLVIALISNYLLGLPTHFTGNFATWWEAIRLLPTIPDFWIWFYLVFTISSTMLPSASDRRAWLPVIIAIALLVALFLLAGAGEWMTANIFPFVNTLLAALSAVMGICLLAHLVFLIPIVILRVLLSKLTGVTVRA